MFNRSEKPVLNLGNVASSEDCWHFSVGESKVFPLFLSGESEYTLHSPTDFFYTSKNEKVQRRV